MQVFHQRLQFGHQRLRPRVGSMPLALRTNSGSSNISRSRFSAR